MLAYFLSGRQVHCLAAALLGLAPMCLLKTEGHRAVYLVATAFFSRMPLYRVELPYSPPFSGGTSDPNKKELQQKQRAYLRDVMQAGTSFCCSCFSNVLSENKGVQDTFIYHTCLCFQESLCRVGPRRPAARNPPPAVATAQHGSAQGGQHSLIWLRWW